MHERNPADRGVAKEPARLKRPVAKPDRQHIPRLRRTSWWKTPMFSTVPGWRAVCSCGWQGKTRVEEDRAVGDLRAHWVESQSATGQSEEDDGGWELTLVSA